MFINKVFFRGTDRIYSNQIKNLSAENNTTTESLLQKLPFELEVAFRTFDYFCIKVLARAMGLLLSRRSRAPSARLPPPSEPRFLKT